MCIYSAHASTVNFPTIDFAVCHSPAQLDPAYPDPVAAVAFWEMAQRGPILSTIFFHAVTL